MRLLKRQFGAPFVQTLSKSPTLVADLAECRRRGVRFRRVMGKCEAYMIPSKKLIGIGMKCSRSYKLTAFAHEMHHFLHGTAPLDRVPKGMSRKRFVNLLLDEETDSIVHELTVVQELLAAGVRMDGETMTWYRRWRRGGRPAIRKMMAKLKNSVSGEPYPVYYSGIYDAAVKSKRTAYRVA